jgi:hypothetical protein
MISVPKSSALLPGEDLVEQGIKDLNEGRITEHALLVLIASPRLEPLGVQVPKVSMQEPFEHQLYNLLSQRLGNEAHSQYNSLLRRIDSYAHALEHERSTDPTK